MENNIGEKNTKLSSISISWGDMEEQKSYRRNQDTGKLELTGSEWEFNPTGSTFIPSWYLDGEFAEYRQELTVEYGPGEEVPEKIMKFLLFIVLLAVYGFVC